MALPLPVFPRRVRLLAVAIVCGIIFYFSVLVIPPETGAPDSLELPTARHLLAYFVLGLSVAYALTDRSLSRRRKALLVFVLATAYGAGIEVAQGFVPERHMTLVDGFVNAAAITASLGWYLIEPYFDQVKIPKAITKRRRTEQ
ncbi:VanZ family protein [Natronoarchaeum sp. GCM10025703]|uniref:VanZ family protein n=1 Tax=unclassified Natronoarchaeum TaxID=2620183 RepID=UPI0036122BE1